MQLISVLGTHKLCYSLKRRIRRFILEGFRFLEERFGKELRLASKWDIFEPNQNHNTVKGLK